MAKTDGYLKVGQKVLYVEDMEQYYITAVFTDTVWIRNKKTNILLKGIKKSDIYD